MKMSNRLKKLERRIQSWREAESRKDKRDASSREHHKPGSQKK